MKDNKKPLVLRVLSIMFTIGFYTIPLGWILKLFFTWGGKVSMIGFIVCVTTLVSYSIHKKEETSDANDR